MEEFGQEEPGKAEVLEVKTFPVPFKQEEIKSNISISTTDSTKTSKEKIMNQAFSFHSQGNIQEAAKYYQYFIDQGFNNHRVFSNYGVILKNIGNLKEAEMSYRKAIEINPNFAQAHSNLGNVLRDLGNLKEAEMSYRKAIGIKPDSAKAHSNLGSILRDLGNLQEAELSTRKAIEIEPDFSQAHSNLGSILKDLGNSQGAELSYRKAIELNPDLAEAHSNLANVLRDLGNLKDAEISTRKAIKLNPNLAEAHLNLGNILKDHGNLQGAELSYRKAIEHKPKYAQAHSNLGSILKDLGNLKEAEICQRKAIELNPDLAEAHSNLGSTLETIGNREEAIRHWEKAVELKPEEDKFVISLANHLCYEKKYELALKYLSKNNSNSCQSLYLGCLLSLDREKDFNKKYKELSKNISCNADIGGIIEHANVIYEKKYESPFCNEAIKYLLIDKINEELFSANHLNELISYNKMSKKQDRSQGLLSNGQQTSGNLFSLDYPFIKSIKKALEMKIEIYKKKFKHSGQGFINNWPENYELRAWMISMRNGGFLKSHNHEYGWITGSFYLQVPKYNANDDSGKIAFSYQGPKYPTKEKKFNLTIKKIENRDIFIFPSSLFHHTIPFASKEKRICFVFDLVQK